MTDRQTNLQCIHTSWFPVWDIFISFLKKIQIYWLFFIFANYHCVLYLWIKIVIISVLEFCLNIFGDHCCLWVHNRKKLYGSHLKKNIWVGLEYFHIHWFLIMKWQKYLYHIFDSTGRLLNDTEFIIHCLLAVTHHNLCIIDSYIEISRRYWCCQLFALSNIREAQISLRHSSQTNTLTNQLYF